MNGILASYRDGFSALDRRGYAAVTSTFLFVAARMSVMTFIAIYLERERGLPLPLIGAAILAENLARGFIAPAGGALSDRFGRTRVLIACTATTALLVPAFLLIHDPVTLFAWSLAMGVAQGPFFPTVIALITDLVPPARRQSALAVNYTGLSLGFTLGVAPAGFLADKSYLALGIASGATYALIAVVLLVVFRHHQATASQSSALQVLRRSLRPFGDRRFLALGALVWVFPFGIGLIAMTLPVYAVDIDLTQTQTGLLLSLNGLLLVVLGIPVNARIERLGPRALLPASGIFTGLSYLALVLQPNAWGIVVTMLVFSLAESVSSAALPTAVSELAPDDARGAYQGGWGFIFAASVGMALFLGGLGRDHIGWSATWLAAAGVTALAGILLRGLRTPRS